MQVVMHNPLSNFYFLIFKLCNNENKRTIIKKLEFNTFILKNKQFKKLNDVHFNNNFFQNFHNFYFILLAINHHNHIMEEADTNHLNHITEEADSNHLNHIMEEADSNHLNHIMEEADSNHLNHIREEDKRLLLCSQHRENFDLCEKMICALIKIEH